MPDSHSALDSVIGDVDRLRVILKRKKAPQVRSSEERSLLKATSLSWFKNYRPAIRQEVDDDLLQDADSLFKKLLSAGDRASSRGLCGEYLKELRTQLSKIRTYAVAADARNVGPTTDAPPRFDTLVPDIAMQVILQRRWVECARCVSASAPLAATVMMGGLLESLLLARILKEKNKSRILGSDKAPKDKTTGKTLPFQDWTLRDYIDVAHDLGWISSSAKGVGEVMRDYRNYIHPHKELSHGVELKDGDAKLFWEISKSIARQLLG